MLCTFILAVLSVFWGTLFNALLNLNSFVVYIVDFDDASDAVVGPILTKLTEKITTTNESPHLGYVTRPPSGFGYDPLQVREAVYENQAWAAMIVMPNATRLLRQAVALGNTSYDPIGACQLIFQDARDADSFYNYIFPSLTAVQTEFVSMVGKAWAAEVFQNASLTRTALEQVPQAINPAIGFSTFNLRPFYPYVAVPSVTVGLIYLIILSFFAFSFFLPIHMKMTQNKPSLHVYQFVMWRWFAAVQSYFFMSLAYSLVSLAFQVPFSYPPGSHTEVVSPANAYGKGTFVVYWMLNWVGMTALGMACENMAMVVGFPWTAMWLIFFVITNVASAFYPAEIEPGFYHWSYAWPLHNIVEASRTLIFDLHSRIGLNFGILFAWCAINTVLYPFASWFMRWKMARGQKKAAEGEAKKEAAQKKSNQ